jgi:hypothetical protein
MIYEIFVGGQRGESNLRPPITQAVPTSEVRAQGHDLAQGNRGARLTRGAPLQAHRAPHLTSEPRPK